MNFSQRIGLTSNFNKIQIDSIDDNLKNGIWNVILVFIINSIDRADPYYGESRNYENFCTGLWHNFFKLPIDSMPKYEKACTDYIRERYFGYEWNKIYELVEYFSFINIPNVNTRNYREAMNDVLEREFSGYRFVDDIIAPITNKNEIDSIEETLNQSNSNSKLEGVFIHIENALKKLSDRSAPDYRNSIKESISAVEAVCRVFTNERTLGEALKKLEVNGIIINNELKSGFGKIYAYSNNKNSGIRHAIIDEHIEPDFEDAKYMLVACSAFINFIVGKNKS